MRVTYIPVYRVWKYGKHWLFKKKVSAQLFHAPFSLDWQPPTVLVECAVVDGRVILPDNVSEV